MTLNNATESHSKRMMYIAIAIVGMMFFIFGFVSWVNAILIPYFRIACELTNFQSYLVTFAFYIAYLVMSIPASFVLKRARLQERNYVWFFLHGNWCDVICSCGTDQNLLVFSDRFIFHWYWINYFAGSGQPVYYDCRSY